MQAHMLQVGSQLALLFGVRVEIIGARTHLEEVHCSDRPHGL